MVPLLHHAKLQCKCYRSQLNLQKFAGEKCFQVIIFWQKPHLKSSVMACFCESHKDTFRLTLSFSSSSFPFFKAFLTLLHWNLVCKSLTSQEHSLHIFNNSQSLSFSTMLSSPSHRNNKQKGGKKTSHSLGRTSITKSKNHISEYGGLT